MSKFTLKTKDKLIKLDSGLEITTKGLLSVKEKNDLTNAFLGAANIKTGDMGNFLGDTIKILTSIIVSWNAFNEDDEPLEISEKNVNNAIGMEDISFAAAEALGLDVEALREKAAKMKS